MLRSIGKHSTESVESVLNEKKKTTAGRISRKGRFLSLGSKSEGVMEY